MSPGPKPYGVDDEEREILKRLVYYRSRNNGKRVLSFASIARILNNEGLRSRQNKPWSHALFLRLYKGTGEKRDVA